MLVNPAGFHVFLHETYLMNPLRITAVSYLNTFPFVYGIRESGKLTGYRLDLAVPSLCAENLRLGEADLALVPAGALPGLGSVYTVSDFCIGAIAEVRTVLLLSHQPLHEIQTICLDFDSRTSVELVRVLAEHHWKIKPAYVKLRPGEAGQLKSGQAVVAIGDKTFAMRNHYPYIYDLAGEWIKFTGLPFVFALWVSKKQLPREITEPFSEALAYGVGHKTECLEYFRDKLPACEDCLGYLENNISFTLDQDKKKGLELFLKYLG
jgi:chorismate dehydratase